jgi:dihydrofolate synthase/folylpolyglutamate synthase
MFFRNDRWFSLRLFRQRKVDIAVIEVGMGGRLDATNIILH